VNEAIRIEAWRVLHAKVRDTETETTHAAVIVMPVAHAEGVDCVLCAHGVCTPTWDRSREPWSITHGSAKS